MIPDTFPVELVSWRRATTLSHRLADIIRASGFLPAYVIAIGRGGFVPARVVCDSLMITNLTSIRIEHWGTAATRFDRAIVRFPLSIEVEGCTLLVIDDVTDTGETLASAIEYLTRKNPDEIRTGVLHHKSSSSFTPDYYAEYVRQWRWITYPWALHEDLVDFAEKILSKEAASPDDLYSALQERYQMNPGMPSFRKALEELVRLRKAVRIGGRFQKPG